MTVVCKDQCRLEPGYIGYPRYKKGFRFCSSCGYSFQTLDYVCICCHQQLRRKSR